MENIQIPFLKIKIILKKITSSMFLEIEEEINLNK
jgi:hypothetical protein